MDAVNRDQTNNNVDHTTDRRRPWSKCSDGQKFNFKKVNF